MATSIAEPEQVLDVLPERIECPLCKGNGEISRTEVLERLGMRDFNRVAQLSAEEAIRVLLKNERQAEQARWAKYELELTKRVAEVTAKYTAELQKLQTEKDQVSLRLKEYERNTSTALNNAKEQQRLQTEQAVQDTINALTKRLAELEAAQSLAEQRKETELAKLKTKLEGALNAEQTRATELDLRLKQQLVDVNRLQAKNQELEAEMAKVARVGRKEEVAFADEVRAWPGIWISAKLPRHGDYMLAFRDSGGNPAEPKMLVDNKDKANITEGDIDKLVRDCAERHCPVGVIVAHDDSQLRPEDRETRWAQKDKTWILRTTRVWLPRDLEVLRPVFERMRVEGPDYLTKNASIAAEIRRTFVDLDEIDKELKKAGTAIENAQTLAIKYRARLNSLCDTAAGKVKLPSQSIEIVEPPAASSNTAD